MNTLAKVLNKIHMIYLGLLPAAATFFVMQGLEKVSREGALIFFIWIAVVGVYLSFVKSYLRPIKNVRRLSLMIIDGPIFAIIGTLSGLNIGDVLIATFLIEVVAIWGSIGYLALSTSRPTFGQMIASTILSVICIGGIVILYWAAGFFNYERYRYLPLIFGVIESIGIKYWILYKDEVVTESTDGILFIVGNIFLRLVTMVVAGIKVNG